MCGDFLMCGAGAGGDGCLHNAAIGKKVNEVSSKWRSNDVSGKWRTDEIFGQGRR